MCGIAGIINKTGCGVPHETLQSMCERVRHRGPDGDGIFIDGAVGLGHRRLAIHDLSTDGAQPMQYLNRYVISFNGEIYNFVELRKELVSLGYQFKSRTDTEVILAAYDRWGEDCVHRFNGMWSFAVYDQLEQTVFCSRDRFGIKPFYFFDGKTYFVFGSEIKQILPFQDGNKANFDVLVDYLVCGFLEHRPDTFFENVLKLSPGHNLTYNLKSHHVKVAPYYDLNPDPNTAELNELGAIESCRDSLYAAVGLRLRSDVKVGTCLSGGMDSSTIAAIAASLYRSNDPFIAITAQASEKALDETGFAQIVAQHVGLDWHTVCPSTEAFKAVLDEVLLLQEEPVTGPSVVMQYFVMREAQSLGCKVMLDGQGGDEILLGYERYYPAVMVHLWKKLGAKASLSQMAQASKNNTKMTLKWVFLYSMGSLFYGVRERFYWHKASFIKPQMRKRFDFLKAISKAYRDVVKLQKIEIQCTNLPMLLKYEDRSSMWHSVEARLPMLDYRLVEKSLGFDPALKMGKGWTKYLLRKAAEKILPPSIIWRKNKLGFNAPESTWLAGYEDVMRATVAGSAILAEVTDLDRVQRNYSRLDSKIKWRLFNIAKWEELYNVHAG